MLDFCEGLALVWVEGKAALLVQVGFFEIVAMPLMRTYCSIFPVAQPLMNSLTTNYRMWTQQLQASQIPCKP